MLPLMLPATLPSALTGASLRLALTSHTQERPALLEGFLHERTVLLIASDAGIGKSTLFTQLGAQASLGHPVFGLFAATRPLKTYYLMSERDVWEPLDRLRRLQPAIPFCEDNLVIDAECVGLRLSNTTHLDLMVNRILEARPDIVQIDPIYGFFEGGMAGDEVAIRVGRFATMILKSSPTPLAIILGHHNVKNTTIPDVSGHHLVQKESPFYGSQFLKAYVTGYYDLSKEKSGTLWRRKKDTYGILYPDFKLAYDPMTGLSHAESTLKLDKRDKLRLFLQYRLTTHQPFSPQDILQAIPMTERYLRDLLKDPDISPLLRVVSENGNITMYESVTP